MNFKKLLGLNTKNCFIEFELYGNVPEEVVETAIPFTSNKVLSLFDIREIFNSISKSEIEVLLLTIKELNIGYARANDIRSYIKDVRDSGKKVYVNLESANNIEYFIASAADYIVAPPFSTLNFMGLATEAYFIKDLLESLEIESEIKGIGEYKSSAEMFTRDSISKYYEEMLNDILENQFSNIMKLVSNDRALKEDTLKSYVNNSPMDIVNAVELGLIDERGYIDDLYNKIKNDFEYEISKIELKSFIRKIKIEKIFKNFINVTLGNKKAIGIVTLNGLITQGKSRYGKTAGSDTIIDNLKTASEDKNIAAIIFRVNSPGGSALASDLIRNQIDKISKEKPIFISMSDLAASGGYMVSLGSKNIVADIFTLTGSIGVISGKFNLSGFLKKIGINTKIISKGEMASIYSMNKPFNQREKKHFNQMIKDMYNNFVELVSKSRKIDFEQAESVSRGRVWTGEQAKNKNLVDDIGSLNSVIKTACEKVNVSYDKDVYLKVIKTKQKLNLSLLPSFGSNVNSLKDYRVY